MAANPQDLLELFNTGINKNVITFVKHEFLEIYMRPTETQRMMEGRLKAELEPFNVMVAFGLNVAVVTKDHNFAPFQHIQCDCANHQAHGHTMWECPRHGEQLAEDTEY